MYGATLQIFKVMEYIFICILLGYLPAPLSLLSTVSLYKTLIFLAETSQTITFFFNSSLLQQYQT